MTCPLLARVRASGSDEIASLKARFAGSLLYVPKDTLHANKCVGEDAGKMLVTQTPGRLYERFFEEMGKPVDGDDAGRPPSRICQT